MGIVRFTPAVLAENLDLVLPRSWKGENFVGWSGGQSTVATDGSAAGGSAASSGRNLPPKAGWIARFWREMPLLEVPSVPGLGEWPLLPITTGELVKCSLLPQVGSQTDSLANNSYML